MATTQKSIIFNVAGLLSLALAPAAAFAVCETTSPPVMYLGTNSVYDIQLAAAAGDRCTIDFHERGDKVMFQSLKPIREPESGKLTRISDFVMEFAPDPAAQSDYFTLKLCGSDIKGPGCSTLRYTAVVKK